MSGGIVVDLPGLSDPVTCRTRRCSGVPPDAKVDDWRCIGLVGGAVAVRRGPEKGEVDICLLEQGAYLQSFPEAYLLMN